MKTGVGIDEVGFDWIHLIKRRRVLVKGPRVPLKGSIKVPLRSPIKDL